MAEDHTQSKKLALHYASTISTLETKQKSPGNVECLISAYKIRFEQAKEHTGLINKEERKTMKKMGIKIEKIKQKIIALIIYSYI